MKLANSEEQEQQFNRYRVENGDGYVPPPVVHESKMIVARPDFYMTIIIILVLVAVGYFVWTRMKKEPKPEDTPLNDSIDVTADNNDDKDQVQLN